MLGVVLLTPSPTSAPLAVISKLGEAGRVVQGMWPPYVDG